MTRHIIITGPMGSGKTTLGRELATRLGRAFLDSDAHIEEATKMTGRQIAEQDGVAHLHRLESAFLLDAVAGHDPAVVACAASVGDQPAILSDLTAAGHTIILLDSERSDDALAARDGAHRRPITSGEATTLRKRRRETAIAAGAILVKIALDDDVPTTLTRIETALIPR